MNVEADALTSGQLRDFSPVPRADASKTKWRVLDEMMEAAEALYKEISWQRDAQKRAREERAGEPIRQTKQSLEDRLKRRDPW